MLPIIILDNGHGGFQNGKYLTDPKTGKFWTHKDGSTIHEGEFNRAIKYRVIEMLYRKNIAYYDLVPEQIDIPLNIRCDRANKVHEENNRNTVLISIHSDAHDTTAKGMGVWMHTTFSAQSKKMAEFAEYLFKEHFPEAGKHRGIKTRNLAICRDTKMPAILIENFFFDNWEDYNNYLRHNQGRDRIAAYIVDIIETYLSSL